MVHKAYEENVAEEAGFGDADYTRFAPHLPIHPAMLPLYKHLIRPRHSREVTCTLFAHVGGNWLLGMGFGQGEAAVYFGIGLNSSRRVQ